MQSKTGSVLDLVYYTVFGVSEYVFQLADEHTKGFNDGREKQKLMLHFVFNTYY